MKKLLAGLFLVLALALPASAQFNEVQHGSFALDSVGTDDTSGTITFPGMVGYMNLWVEVNDTVTDSDSSTVTIQQKTGGTGADHVGYWTTVKSVEFKQDSASLDPLTIPLRAFYDADSSFAALVRSATLRVIFNTDTDTTDANDDQPWNADTSYTVYWDLWWVK